MAGNFKPTEGAVDVSLGGRITRTEDSATNSTDAGGELELAGTGSIWKTAAGADGRSAGGLSAARSASDVCRITLTA